MNKTKVYKTIFFGTPDFSVPVLQTLNNLEFIKIASVVTQPDKPVGKKQVLTSPPVKVFAQEKNIPVIQPDKIKTEEFHKIITDQSPDLIIVIAYGKIIPKQILGIPEHGWLNVHASLLPKHRGASPIQSAILQGDEKTGVTLMKINARLDTGPIISQKETSIEKEENFETLHDKLSQLGAELINNDLLNYLEGKLTPQLQNNNQASSTKIIKKEDGKIDWHQSAEKIERKIRAYTPWPGAYCFWENKRLKILGAEANMLPKKIEPGEIFAHGEKIIVSTGADGLNIIKLQLAGKKPQPIANFLKGHPEFKNTKLT